LCWVREFANAADRHLGYTRMIGGRNDRVPWRLVMLT
jgi:hypothetical protein